MAALLLIGGTMTVDAPAQEYLHLFYKNGDKEKIEITKDTKVEFVKHPYLTENFYSTYNNDTIFMSASAGRTSNYGLVYSNVPWVVTADADWLLVRVNENDNYTTSSGYEYENCFMIYATANETEKERVAHVTIATEQNVKKTFTVVQRPYTLSFYENAYINIYRYDGEPVDTFTIEGTWDWNNIYYNLLPNFGWEVTSYPDWMTMNEFVHGAEYCDFETIEKAQDIFSAGTPIASSVSFRFEPNELPDSRTGYITFEGHGQKAVGIFRQEGLNEQTIINEAEILVKRMYQYNNLGQGNHNDFGFPSLMLTLDSRGTDLVADNSGYNWFSHALDYSDLTSNYVYTAMYWTTMYNQINAANEVIRAYSERKDDSKFQFYLAQAYALRAFNYFYLAQLYQQTYIGNEDAPCVPIIWEGNMDIANTEGCARATVKEVYDFIFQDLDLSLELLQQTETERPSKRYVNAEVIYGLRARINMVRGEWQAAAEDAQRIIEAGTATPYTIGEVSKPTFNDINHGAWLWGIDTEEDDSPVTTGLCNWPSHMGSFSYGYASSVGVWRKVSKSLYDAIPSTDVRKGWFLDNQSISANLTAEQKEHVTSSGMPAYTQVKFAPYKNELGTSTNASDIPLMRIEEIYLILAEAQAMMGNTAKALNTLNTFVTTYRDEAYECSATTTEEILDAIWMQRRIELWGEGHSYFDLMRMKKGVDRRGAGFQPDYVYNIPAGDAALIYPIPDREMNSNPNLIQNPVAEHPVPVKDGDGTSVYEKLQGNWKWNCVDNTGKSIEWNVTVTGVEKGEEGYNEVLQISGIMNYEWTSMTMFYVQDEETGIDYVYIPFGYIFAEDVNFGLEGTQDVATGTAVDGYISFEGGLVGIWNDDFTEITFEEDKIMYGFLTEDGQPNGYTWFNCLNIKMSK